MMRLEYDEMKRVEKKTQNNDEQQQQQQKNERSNKMWKLACWF